MIAVVFSLNRGGGRGSRRNDYSKTPSPTSLNTLYCNWGCTTYTDGCNSCYCQDDGSAACTEMACETYGKPSCLECKSNTEWYECGSPCTITCDNPDLRCIERCQARCECPDDLPLWNGTACVVEDDCPECPSNQVWNNCGSACTPTCEEPDPECTRQCVSRCECPEDLPIWNGEECIEQEDCSDFTTTIEPLVLQYCSNGCTSYFDGCNFCSCQSTTEAICTLMACSEYKEDYCSECESNKVWSDCASECDLTCENPDLECTERCVAKCACPEDLPIWNEKECITLAECSITEEPETTVDLYDKYCNNNCTSYYDGCNICTCSEGTSICTLRFCSEMEDDYCIACESNMEWNECGSSCTKTCEYYDFECDEKCNQRCECPEEYPIWNGQSCVQLEDCLNTETNDACDSYCSVWFDGCNDCSCQNGVIGGCTKKACTTYEDAYCKKCENDLEWNECISCFRTCDSIDIECAEYCRYEGCACPSSKPYYDADDGQCKTQDECLETNQQACSCQATNGNKGGKGKNRKSCTKWTDETTCNGRNCQWVCE